MIGRFGQCATWPSAAFSAMVALPLARTLRSSADIAHCWPCRKYGSSQMPSNQVKQSTIVAATDHFQLGKSETPLVQKKGAVLGSWYHATKLRAHLLSCVRASGRNPSLVNKCLSCGRLHTPLVMLGSTFHSPAQCVTLPHRGSGRPMLR